MDQNTGSFMSPAAGQPEGFGPELSALMGQSPNSGMGATPLQNSQAPGGPMGPNAPQTQAIPQALAQPGGAMSAPASGQAALPPRSQEAMLVLGAMKEYLKHIGEVNKHVAGIQRK